MFVQKSGNLLLFIPRYPHFAETTASQAMLGGEASQSTDSYLLGEEMEEKSEKIWERNRRENGREIGEKMEKQKQGKISFTGVGNIAPCRNWFSCFYFLCLAHPDWEHSSFTKYSKISAKLI